MDSFAGLELVTDSVTEPVSLAEAKTHLRIDSAVTADDTYITALITAARKAAELYCHRAFFTQTWKLTLNSQPSEIFLPNGYVQSITTIKTYAEDGTSVTELSSLYFSKLGEGAHIYLKSGSSWTSTTRAQACFEITYVCGQIAVPEILKEAIKIIVADLYENRGDQGEEVKFAGQISGGLSAKARALLDAYRVVLI